MREFHSRNMSTLLNETIAVDDHTQVDRKRLGQFFTGQRLARLLAAIAGADHASSVIDPMCGTGDMLAAVVEIGPESVLEGIEIDTGLANHAKMRIHPPSGFNLVAGNAFDLRNLTLLSAHCFDLVITNPPYVRYQMFSESANGREAPSALSVRDDLLKSADYLLSDPQERESFHRIIRAYSGLSDLAVPSWILCAMLTKVGGTLALVVPESWLSRNYAQIIQYLLFRWFKIKYVVEDVNASWFPSALVKTTLLVAERIQARPSAFTWQDEAYLHVCISSGASTESSIVGNIFPDVESPERQLAKTLESLLLKRERKDGPLWSVEVVRLSDAADNLRRAVGPESWFRTFEPNTLVTTNAAVLPTELRRWMRDKEKEVDLVCLEQVLVAIGQGLRTGANPFFYVDVVKEHENSSTVTPHKMFHFDSLQILSELLHPVVRRQSELSEGYRVDKDSLNGRVLVIREHSLAGDLAKLVDSAERTKIGDRLIPELSAVRPNALRKNAGTNHHSKWYSLPTFAPRHVPALLVPRVNGVFPRTYLNYPGVVVDANFSTIWLKPDSAYTELALLALLNSTWSITAMELIGSVMGGGALKLEATHLKKIPIPKLTDNQIKMLHSLGDSLARSSDPQLVDRIDEVVMEAFWGRRTALSKLNDLKQIAGRRLEERSTRA